MQKATLFIVATPIGNLEDMTYRAVRVLGEVDLIAAEDTRRSQVLLAHYEIDTPLISVYEHNEDERIPALLLRLAQGQSIALVSDAGTPLISDPGFRLLRAVVDEGFSVIPVPGPSALTAAISVAGLPPDRFFFEGFLPAKHASRVKGLERLSRECKTMIFFESNHRILATLRDMRTVFGSDREVVLCRELTKKFETVLRGDLDLLITRLEEDENQTRGECVVLIGGYPGDDTANEGHELARALLEFLPASQAARVAARVSGNSRRELYEGLKNHT